MQGILNFKNETLRDSKSLLIAFYTLNFKLS